MAPPSPDSPAPSASSASLTPAATAAPADARPVALPKAPAADSLLRILMYLASQRGPVPAARIAADLNLPRSSTYDLLTALVARNFALHLPDARQYALGPAAYEISAGYLRHAPLARVGRRAVERMVDAVGESGHLAVLHGRDVMYLVEERARMRPSLVSDIGVRIPAHLTASGRAMLAALPPVQLRALYGARDALEQRHDDAGPATPGQLRRLLADVRRDGVAWELGEVTPTFRSVAAAICDTAGWPVAAVALTWADGTVSVAREAECEDAVRREARWIAAALGGQPT